jgi:hypothetical protein
MAISQLSPTTFYFYDPMQTFSQWLQSVANMKDPPLVFSISYSQDEKLTQDSELRAFQNLAIQLGARGMHYLFMFCKYLVMFVD